MARSHPPTLLTLIRRSLREECGVKPGEHVLVAVSGGGDSAGLLHSLSQLRSKLRLELWAHGVDHGLRPEAAGELELARRLAARCAVPFSTSRVQVEPGGNLQARARAARFESLRQAAAHWGAEFIATAHHADDRAETVLMRLLRGAGPRGLAALPARSGVLLRPMIRARKSDILAHLARHRIEYADDPSNEDRRFLRVRVRRDLLPGLESLSPRIVDHLCALADQLGAQPPPEVRDAAGQPIALGRSQVAQIRRAQALGLPGVTVSVAGSQLVTVESRTGRIALQKANQGQAPPSRRTRGGARAHRHD